MHVAFLLTLMATRYIVNFLFIMSILHYCHGKAYIVTGGQTKTTETLVRDGGTAWKSAAQLPSVSKATGIRGVGYNGQFIVAGDEGIGYFPKIFNTFIIKGGRSSEKYINDVLEYNAKKDQWKTVGHLAKGRQYHGMSLVPYDTENYCF